MDSHIVTSDPWAATLEAPEPEAQELHEAESDVDDVVEAESASAEAGDKAASKGGLFGRRKIRERTGAPEEGGFDLIAPAPHLIGEDPDFEVVESDILTEAPDLGLGDKIVAPEEVALEPSLPMADPLDDSILSEDDTFDSMSEEIANAVANAQPAGIFGALANPVAHFIPQNADVAKPTVNGVVEDAPEEAFEDVGKDFAEGGLTEDTVEDAQDLNEESPEAAHESFIEDEDVPVDEVTDLPGKSLDEDSVASDELDYTDEADASADELETDADVQSDHDSEETLSADEQEADEPITEQEDEPVVSEDLLEPDETIDKADGRADAFEDTPAEMQEDTLEADEIVEQPEIEEPSMDQLTATAESGFSLTNAPAESIEGEEDLFVSASTEESIQEVVLVTTDTVPGMKMGDSCGLVTTVRAADEAASLPKAIKKAHADLRAKAEEAGATAVISVTTDVNEVQAGFLVIASGTAVLAVS